MKKKLPTLKTDLEAETFVAESDLSEFDLSNMRMTRFELKPKNKSINLRLPEKLFLDVQEEARHKGITYSRFIRLALEKSLTPKRRGRSEP